MASSPLNNGGERESDKTSRIFCDHVNFPKMNVGISVHGWQSQIVIKRGLVIINNTFQK